VNLASAIAALGKRVLLVDSDPQCNLTSYLVEEAVVNDLLENSDRAGGRTLWSALKPIVESTGEPRLIAPVELPRGLDLIAGDIRLAEFESELAPFWGESFQRRIRGFRGTASLSMLVNAVATERESDVVFYDTGPNIGALNRAILLDCDYFIIPAACDLFSLRAIRTLGQTLTSWINDWRTIEKLAPEDIYLLPGMPKPLGYVPQRFRVYASRPTTAYSDLLPKIEASVEENVINVLQRLDPALVSKIVRPLKIAEIKDFGSLANEAQLEGKAIWQIDGGTPDQREEARLVFRKFAKSFLQRTGLE
jgi:cellulose biosynthesis protein BcsQ